MGSRLVLKGRKGLVSITDGSSTETTVVSAAGALPTDMLNRVTVTLTAAELLALNTTPKSLIAAPGTGLTLEVVKVHLTLNYLTAYTIGSATNLNVNYTNGSGAATCVNLSSTGFLDATASTKRMLANITTNITPVSNAALVLSLAGGNPSGGTSTVTVDVWYRTV